MVLSSSGIRGTKFNPVYNFPAQQHPSFENQHILNFKVMVVRDITRGSLLLKNIHLSRDFSVQIISRLESQSKFQMFTLFTSRQVGGLKRSSILGSVCNFAQNISMNISAMGQHIHLKLGELSSLFIVYNITIFSLYPLNSF